MHYKKHTSTQHQSEADREMRPTRLFFDEDDGALYGAPRGDAIEHASTQYLRDLAKEFGVTGYSRMSKQRLVDTLRARVDANNYF